MHRPSNVDHPDRLKSWISSIGEVAKSKDWDVIFPVHPRTAKMAESTYGPNWKSAFAEQRISVREPAGYLQMIEWLKEVRQVWTDSGGLQKEAFFMWRPAVILRDTSEWTELLDHGVARLCPEPEALMQHVDFLQEESLVLDFEQPLYGQGTAGTLIAQILKEWLNR
jgi:UDP-GlcNAc3NAcA epimerase